MGIDRDRVRPLDPVEQAAGAVGRQGGTAVRGVHVHPQPALLAHACDPGEIVHDARVRRSPRRDHREGVGGRLRVEERRQRVARQPPARVARDLEQLRVHHPAGGRDRGVHRVGGDHRSGVRLRGTSTAADRLASGDQGGEVGRGPTGHEHATRVPGQPGDVGEPAQRLVLGIDRPRRVEPRRCDDARRRDDLVEQDRGRRGRVRDEREVRRMIGRHAGGPQHLAPHAQGLVAAETRGGHGALGRGRQLLEGSWAAQRRGPREPRPNVGVDRGEQPVGFLGEGVHAHVPSAGPSSRRGAAPCLTRPARGRTRRTPRRSVGCRPRSAARTASTAPRHRGS